MPDLILSGETWSAIRAKINAIGVAAGDIAANVTAAQNSADAAADSAASADTDAGAAIAARAGAEAARDISVTKAGEASSSATAADSSRALAQAAAADAAADRAVVEGAVDEFAALTTAGLGDTVSLVPADLSPITLGSADFIVSDVYASGLPQFSPDDWEQVGDQLTLKRAEFIGTEIRYRYRIAGADTLTDATLSDGSPALPSLGFLLDPDTGIYRDGANVLAFAAGGQKRGHVSPAGFRMDVLMTGLAVVQSTSDVTAGRLLTTGPGPAQAFRRGNVLGALAMSAGIPTGALIERGANANGEFMKLADGTQLCYGSITSSASAAVTMTYPASFFVTPKVFALPAGSASRQITWTGRGNTSVDLHCFNLAGGRESVAIDVLIVGRWA